MTVLWFDVCLWLANRLLDLATAILPEACVQSGSGSDDYGRRTLA